jgi:hypothetical protein
MRKRNVNGKGFSSPTSQKVPTKARCPKSGRASRCGSRLAAERASLHGTVASKLAKLGGVRADAPSKRGSADDGFQAPSEKSTKRHGRIDARPTYSDEYYTPPNAIDILLPFLPKNKIIFECAWGKGHLARHLRKNGFTVVGSPSHNFVTDQPPKFDVLVTNPPFSQKEEFIRRAYRLKKPFAILLPAFCLTRVAFSPLFLQHGIQLLVPNKRIHFLGGSEKYQKCPGSNFHSFWFCHRLLPQDLCFAELKVSKS